ncbi:Histone-lysine N-methyltransferase NSD2 [Nymphon striatum]|nr:Histone-lysine N-methyltransferase NSD2 [Nymphon striatum]
MVFAKKYSSKDPRKSQNVTPLKKRKNSSPRHSTKSRNLEDEKSSVINTLRQTLDTSNTDSSNMRMDNGNNLNISPSKTYDLTRNRRQPIKYKDFVSKKSKKSRGSVQQNGLKIKDQTAISSYAETIVPNDSEERNELIRSPKKSPIKEMSDKNVTNTSVNDTFQSNSSALTKSIGIKAFDSDVSTKDCKKPKDPSNTLKDLSPIKNYDNESCENSLSQGPNLDKLIEKGTLLWVKIQTYPYWPCIVTADPITGQYYKRVLIQGTKRKVLNENDAPSKNDSDNSHSELNLKKKVWLQCLPDHIRSLLHDATTTSMDKLFKKADALIEAHHMAHGTPSVSWIHNRSILSSLQVSSECPYEGYSYHVRFFGPKVERSWTNPKCIRFYKGGRHYLNQFEKLLSDAKESQTQKKRKKSKVTSKMSLLNKQYGIRPSFKEVWDNAVEEADRVISMPVNERLQKFSFENIINASNSHDSKKSETAFAPKVKKRKISMEKSSPKKLKLGLGSLADFRKQMKLETSHSEQSSSSDEDVYQFSAPKVLKNSKNFEVFYQKIQPQLRKSHKGIGDKDLNIIAEKLWIKMSLKQQSRYKASRSSVKAQTLEKTVDSPDSASRKLSMKIKIGKFGKFEASVSSSITSMDNSSYESQDESSKEKSVSPTAESVLNDADTSLKHLSNELLSKLAGKVIRRSKIPSIHSFEEELGNGDQVCQICDKTGENLVVCKGTCLGMFHAQCISNDKEIDSFTCEECSSGKHTCFICKEKTADTTRCNVAQCGKFYHSKCLKKYQIHCKFEGARGLSCPLHYCLSCVNNELDLNICKASKAKLVRCIRCPTAYHKTESCVVAGCSLITPSLMICYDHFEPKKGNPHHSKINVNWCFICSNGGSLICCESCPAAFHTDCLNIEPPEGNFYCDDCLERKQPPYGSIVWVKLGSYRSVSFDHYTNLVSFT